VFVELFADMQRVKIDIDKEVTIPIIKDKNLQDISYKKQKIKIAPFYIGKYEVTKKEYNNYLKSRVKEVVSLDEYEENEPITNISFITAQDVCKFYGGRLLSEEEWIVASSIKLSQTRCYEDIKQYSFSNYAITPNAIDCMVKEDDEIEEELIGKELLEVQESYENLNGTYGMFGNVWEYVESFVNHFGKNYAVIKGGSYASERILFDNRVQNFIDFNQQRQNIGFRCGWDIPKVTK
jgi:formylglycine-generating enzyme required for sulfatase activity